MAAFVTLPHTALTPVYDALPVDNLFSARKVSSAVYHRIEEYTSITFGLNRLYGSFFSSTEEISQFRLVQHESRGLVSGTSLVYVLSRSGFPLMDLDIFLPDDCLKKVGLFLLRAGYRCSPVQVDSDDSGLLLAQQESAFLEMLATGVRRAENLVVLEGYEDSDVSSVFVFEKTDGRKIQLIGTKTEPIQVVLGFYSTLIMNFATANEIISLYPITSFVDHSALYLRDITPPLDVAKKRYEEMGWGSMTMVSARTSLDSDDELSFKTRWVGDRHCWVVPLPPLPELDEQPDGYKMLRVASWLLHSPAPNVLQMVRNRLDADAMRGQFAIVWKEDEALWTYNCFRNMEGRFRWVTAASEGFLAVDGMDGDAQESDDLDLDRAEWACISSRVSPNDMFIAPDGQLHEDLVRFLDRLYPVLDGRYRENFVLEHLREEFGCAFQQYSVIGDHVHHPTGRTVTVILQCLEEVLTVARCDDIEFTVEFSFDWDRDRVWTAFKISVPDGEAQRITDDISHWPKEEFKAANLEVFVASYA
ncbi:hypothetical protein VNI00_018072 [Paramarasmius palmivorus]|uniref:F-box domain-containing protein n=1 Tax=Paramarasmius palmivorus TaxID=297713 RepID=A0AAW0B490_9AGAR